MALKSKGKGKGGDEDEESPFMPLEEVLRKLKAGPLNFGVYQTGDKDNPVLIAAHKRKNAEVLGKQAKKEAGTTKGAFGKLTLESGELKFECENDGVPKTLAKKIKVMLRSSGFAKFKPRVILPGGEELGEDAEDDEEDIIAPGGSATKTHKGGSNLEANEEKAAQDVAEKYGELRPVLETLIEAGDSKVAGQAMKLMKMMDDTLRAQDFKKAKGALVVVEKFVENALEDIGDSDGDPSEKGGAGTGGGSAGGGSAGGGASGGGAGGGAAASGAGAASGGAAAGGGAGGGASAGGGGAAARGGGGAARGGGSADDEAAAAARAEAQRIALGAAEASSEAENSALAASQSLGSAVAAAADALVAYTIAHEKVGEERAAPVQEASERARVASDEAQAAADQARGGSALAEAMSAQAQRTADNTRDPSGIAETRTYVASAADAKDKAALSAADADQANSRAIEGKSDAEAACERVIAEAEAEKTRAEGESQAIVDGMKAKVSSAPGTAAIDALVADLEAEIVRQQAILDAALPNRGTIGDAQRAALEAHKTEAAAQLEAGKTAVENEARRLAEEAEARAKAEQAAHEQSTRDFEAARQQADAEDQAFEAAKAAGGEFYARLVEAKRTYVRQKIDEVGQHNAKAGEALRETQSGVQKLFGAVSKAAGGFIDRALDGQVRSVTDLLRSASQSVSDGVAGVTGATRDFAEASAAGIQAARDEAGRLKTQATEQAQPWIDKAKTVPDLVGPPAVELYKQAQAAKGVVEKAVDTVLDMARSFGGSLFDAAADEAQRKKDEASSAIGTIISTIDALRDRITTELDTAVSDIQSRGEAVAREVRERAQEVARVAGQQTPSETDFTRWKEELGTFAEELVKARVDEVKRSREQAAELAKGVETLTEGFSALFDDLRNWAREKIEQLLPDLGDDPVAPAEEEARKKAAEAEEKAKAVETSEKDAQSAYADARKAAESWLKGIADDIKAKVDAAREAAAKADGDGAGLENGVIAGISDAIKALGEQISKAGSVGGKVGAEAVKAAEDAQKAIEEDKKKLEAAIKKVKEALKTELETARKVAADSKAQRTELSNLMKTGDEASGPILKTFEGKYGKWKNAQFDAAWSQYFAASGELDRLIVEWQGMVETLDKAIEDAARAMGADDNVGDVRAARDAVSKATATFENIATKFPDLKSRLQKGYDGLKQVMPKVDADFKAMEKRYVDDAKAQLKTVEGLMQAARGGDEKARKQLVDNGASYVGGVAMGVNTFDNLGGSECTRVRTALALDRDRIAVQVEEAAKLPEGGGKGS